MGSIGTPELIIGLIVVFFLFGAKRMPEAARGLGRSLKIFKTEMQASPSTNTADSKLEEQTSSTPASPAPAPPVLPAAEPTVTPAPVTKPVESTRRED